jgi:hypothetical protein
MAVSKHDTIPAAALNQHIAALGKTGSGKTYALKGIVEQLLDHGRQTCVLDPTGAWWGLRLAADGKGRGYDVVLIGGQHNDIPLSERSGAAVARLVTEQHANVVIDTSGFTVGQYTRWFIDFAGTLYTTIRSPLHLVIDEAHYFMPQGKSPDVDAGRMLHAGNRLMSGGRSKGVRGLLATQRPAKLHKDSLTCVDTMIAMRVIAPQDRAAIKDWIDGAGDPKQGREVLDSLAQLQKGEGWVWYPEGGHLQRVKFPKIRTFDSSATPDHGAKAGPKIAEIKLDEVRSAMAEAVREAEANDPQLLRKRIAELESRERKRSEAPPATPATPAKVERVEIPVVTPEDFTNLSMVSHSMQASADQIASSLQSVVASIVALTQKVETFRLASHGPRAVRAGVMPPPPATKPKPAPPARGVTSNGEGLGNPERELLAAFAWFAHIGVSSPAKEQLCFKLGWRPTSGHIKNVLGKLRSAGLVDGLTLTDAGRREAAWPAKAATLAEYHSTLRECLDGPQRLVFDLLLNGEMSRDDICEALGWSTQSGHIKNVIGALRTFGVVERKGWKLSPLVYPDGLE